MKSKRVTRNKRKKQRRTQKNNKEAKKYLDFFNLALKHIRSNFVYEFTEEDINLFPYIKQGIKKGWRILQDKNIAKEISCNSLCMTISILNSTIGEKKFESLNILHKIYLFFLSYLIDDEALSKKEVTLSHAIKKLDLRIINETKRYEKYERENNTRGMKKSSKFILDQQKKIKQLLDSNGEDKTGIHSLFRLDICNAIDCEYLQEYKMSKGEKWNKSYSKFCLNITEIFKGIVWLNMYLIFKKKTNPFKISPTENNLPLNLDIRSALNRVDILLVPDHTIYEGDIFYEDTFEDENRKVGVSMNRYWVYTDFDLKNGKCKKLGVSGLENKHYVIAFLKFPYNWKLSKERIATDTYKLLQDFLQGKGPLPKLKEIYKQKKNIGGEERYDLGEDIENTITVHWLYAHRDVLNNIIETWS
jgi:hypothetical protein